VHSGPPARAQTADEVNALITRLVDLDSIDLAKEVKFRPAVEPSLHALDADESAMTVLKDPYEVFGRGKPGAAGWYRVSFVVPETLGKIAIPKNGYNLGVETNVLGSWEVYTYINGKPAGLWSKDGMLRSADRHASFWLSNAPMPTKAGDRITVALLATASPLGRGSPDGFGLRHLRLRFALAHTAARRPFFGEVTAPGQGVGLFGAREKLATLKGDELAKFQQKVKGPLSRVDTVFAAGETGKLDELTKAMRAVGDEVNEALRPERKAPATRPTTAPSVRP
jgi:hypothetical protein